MNDPGRRALERRISRKADRRKSPPKRSAAAGGRHNDLVFGERQRREFEANPRPMRIFDRETLRYLAVNDAALALYGYSRAEFLALTLKDTRHPDEHDDQLASFDRPEGYLIHLGPVRHVKKSGEIIIAEVITQDVLFKGRRARVSLTIDVTERTRMTELLRQREQEFETLAEHLPDPVARFDRAGRFVYVNSAVEQLTGASRDAMLGRTQRELGMPAAIVSLFESSLAGSVRTGQSHTLEFSFPQLSGERLFEAYHVPERNAAGEIATVLCVARDITERKKGEVELRRQKDLLAAIIDNLPVGIFIRDAKTLRYLLRNRYCEKTFGHATKECWAGKSVHDLFSKRDADLAIATDRQALESGAMLDIPEIEWRVGSGEVQVQHVRKVPLYEDNGEPWLLVGIAEDITERKRAENALRESNEFLRSVIESSRDCIKVLDLEGRLISISTGGQRLMEIGDTSAVLGKWYPEFFSGGDRDAAHAALAAARSGDAARFEAYCPTMSGVPRWWDEMVTPILGKDGSPEKLLVVSRDITENKRAAQTLQDSEARFALVVENIALGMWDWNARTGEVWRHPRWSQILGYRPEEVPGHISAERELCHPDDWARAQESLAAHFDGKTSLYGTQYRMRAKTGAWIWIRCRGKVIERDADGSPARMIGYIRDISERRGIEDALRESEERFRQLAENIREVFWINTPAGDNLIYVSPACEEIWGRTRESLYSHPRAWMEPIHPDDLPAVQAAEARMPEGKETNVEYRIIRPDGTVRWIRDRSYPMKRGDGAPLVCGIAEDITEQKRAEEERLTHAIHQRDALVREVHHRIKNHLQGIAGLLRNQAAENPAARETIEAAVAQMQSVAVVYGLQSELAESGVPLARVLEAICSSAEGLSATRIRRGFDPDAGHVRLAEAEAVPVAVALNELVFNAIEHGSRRGGNGSIEVAFVERENGADIRIANRGTLPARFHYALRRGTGTGLELVRTLLGPAGVNLEFGARDGKVEVTLSLRQPLVTACKTTVTT